MKQTSKTTTLLCFIINTLGLRRIFRLATRPQNAPKSDSPAYHFIEKVLSDSIFPQNMCIFVIHLVHCGVVFFFPVAHSMPVKLMYIVYSEVVLVSNNDI